MNKVISIFTIIIAITALSFSIWTLKSDDKAGLVLLNELYEKFEFSKEMLSKYESLELKRNALLDSLKYNVLVAERQKSKDLEYFKQLYFYKSEEFEKSNAQVKAQYDELIWKQINQYINDYGKENHYKYIYGASGNGNIMYGAEDVDITKNVIVYLNKKYKGIK